MLIKAGATSRSVDLFFQDSSSTTGDGLPGLAYNSAGLTCYYRKGATGTLTAVTLATQTVGGAYSSGGFVKVDDTNAPGMCRFDIPNAAIDTVGFTTFYFKGAADMAPLVLRVQCVSFDPEDTVRLGLTALPNVAQGNSGQIALGDASGRTTPVPSESVLTRSGTAQAGASTTITLDASASATNSLYVGQVIRIVSGTGAGQARVITAYVGSTKVATVDGAWSTNPDNTSVFAVLAFDAATRTVSNKLGAWTGSGLNTVLGALRAIANKASSLTPTDISSGGTFDNTTDSLEAQSDGAAFTTTIKNAIADALLTRSFATLDPSVSNTGRNALNALRRLRNMVDASSGTTMRVKGEDDTTDAWTATLTSDASAEPIIKIDPA